MVWRSCLIWSGRVVRAGRAPSAKRASAWKDFGIGRVEAGEARRSQPVARRLAGPPRRLQPVAQGHQFIDLGDDPALFRKGWEYDRYVDSSRLVELGACRANNPP